MLIKVKNIYIILLSDFEFILGDNKVNAKTYCTTCMLLKIEIVKGKYINL